VELIKREWARKGRGREEKLNSGKGCVPRRWGGEANKYFPAIKASPVQYLL
jgi:hypothetical protein